MHERVLGGWFRSTRAAGIVESKVDVLAAALHRGDEAVWLGLHREFAAAETPTRSHGRSLDRFLVGSAGLGDAVADPGECFDDRWFAELAA
jgi:hypothetical protein